MLLRATLELPLPVATAAERLSALLLGSKLDQLSDDAYYEGMLALARVGPFGDVPGLSKTVQVETLDQRTTAEGIRIPFRWVATGRSGHLFPTLDADLDVSARDDRSCMLTVNAAYTPPMGAAGATLDRMVMHRAARATMRSLLRGLGRAILADSADSADRASGIASATASGTEVHRDDGPALAEVQFYPDAPPASG